MENRRDDTKKSNIYDAYNTFLDKLNNIVVIEKSHFVDNEIEGEIFYNIIEYININNINKPLLVTPILYVDEQNENNNSILPNNLTWLLGKFIQKSFLVNNNIHFKPIFFTHEDLNFLTQIEQTLILQNIDICWFNEDTFIFYYYMKNNNSITCKMYSLNIMPVIYEIYSMIEFLDAYIKETDIFLYNNKDKIDEKNRNNCWIHMVESIMFIYFAYQYNWFIFGYYGRPYSDLKPYIDIIEKHLEMSIIDYLYINPWIYTNTFLIDVSLLGHFLEKESLINFLNNVKNRN